MPTYEYVCEACPHEFEEFQSITAKALRKCPACGQRKLKRLIGVGAGVIFKGSGFYETDYRSDDYKKAAKKEKEASTPADASKGDGKGASDGKSPGAEKAGSSDKDAGDKAKPSDTKPAGQSTPNATDKRV